VYVRAFLFVLHVERGGEGEAKARKACPTLAASWGVKHACSSVRLESGAVLAPASLVFFSGIDGDTALHTARHTGDKKY
jgi:hypothetical protein